MAIPAIDAKHAIAHNKIMVIDGATVITGSSNFTKADKESNAENLLVIRDKALADKYATNWKEHADHSEPYASRVDEVKPEAKAPWASPGAEWAWTPLPLKATSCRRTPRSSIKQDATARQRYPSARLSSTRHGKRRYKQASDLAGSASRSERQNYQ